MAKRLTMGAEDDIEARRLAGERERRVILIRVAAEDAKARLAAFGGSKGKSEI